MPKVPEPDEPEDPHEGRMPDTEISPSDTGLVCTKCGQPGYPPAQPGADCTYFCGGKLVSVPVPEKPKADDLIALPKDLPEPEKVIEKLVDEVLKDEWMDHRRLIQEQAQLVLDAYLDGRNTPPGSPVPEKYRVPPLPATYTDPAGVRWQVRDGRLYQNHGTGWRSMTEVPIELMAAIASLIAHPFEPEAGLPTQSV